jgi:hypothetical protein
MLFARERESVQAALQRLAISSDLLFASAEQTVQLRDVQFASDSKLSEPSRAPATFEQQQ